MRAAVCTIVAKNYLAFARVLMNSVREHNPHLLRFVVLVDRIDGFFEPRDEPFEVVLAEDLGIPNPKWFWFKYTVLELSTAVKPYVLEYLCRHHGLDAVVYLDPDIKLYSPLDRVLSSLERQNMLLTPHLTAPLADQARPGDLDILRSGAYNLGFIALRNNSEMSGFLEWWKSKLYDDCLVDLERGLFVDQRWMDLAPSLFPGVVINRNPGYNIAYWNLQHRVVGRTAAGYTVNGEPLCFFHYSGFDPADPELFSRHQNRFRLSDLGVERELVEAYAKEVLAAGYLTCRSWPYAYGRFQNDHPIPDVARRIHREAPELLERVDDPFSNDAFDEIVRIWNEPVVRNREGKRAGVTRFAYRVYTSRADVQAEMPNIFGRDYARFLDWLLSSGKAEHSISSIFLVPVWEALKATRKHRRARTGFGRSSTEPAEASNEGPYWYKLRSPVSRMSPSELGETTGPGSEGHRLTRLARAIHEARADLQQSMPDPTGRDGAKFLIWLLTYGVIEYGLTQLYLAPIRRQWDEFLATLSLPQRIRKRALLAAAKGTLSVRVRANWLMESWKYHLAGKSLRRAGARGVRESGEVTRLTGPFGLNLVGYLSAEMGIGQAGRSALAAARAAGIPNSIKVVTTDGHYREEDPSGIKSSSQHPYCYNLFHVNADQTMIISARLGEELRAGKYNIGFWAWELEDFPERWERAFRMYQEIWTPSSFCQEALARRSPIPVVRIPPCVSAPEPSEVGREELGLPARGFLFLCLFDMRSVMERKNPIAAVEAFRSAFDSRDDCHLIVKVNNAHSSPENLARLREAAAGERFIILDRPFSRPDVMALLNHCDCLVSLHRSEGFGLVLAEAMSLGKPVIATAYSGNLDFTKPGNSLLVGFKMARVGKGCEPYDEQCMWADPDPGEAVRQMRAVFESEQLRREISSAARTYVSRHLSPSATGQLMEQRLRAILRQLGRPDAARATMRR